MKHMTSFFLSPKNVIQIRLRKEKSGLLGNNWEFTSFPSKNLFYLLMLFSSRFSIGFYLIWFKHIKPSICFLAPPTRRSFPMLYLILLLMGFFTPLNYASQSCVCVCVCPTLCDPMDHSIGCHFLLQRIFLAQG